MRSKGSRCGSALLTVLWLTAALAAIGLAVANNVRGETERTATNVADAKSYFVARGAIERTLLYMFRGPDFYRAGQPAMDFRFPEGEAHVDIVPEASKLSLNGAPAEELARLLAALGQPEDRALAMTAAIADWRTPVATGKQSPLDAFYLAQAPSFQPRHASFLENEELLLVKGITPDLYYGTSLDGSRAGLRDCVSAYSNSSAVDINTAKTETMMAAGIGAEDAAAIVKRRAAHPILDYRELAEIQQALGPAGARLRIGGASMYTIRATVRHRSVAALVKLWYGGNKEGKPPGAEVVRWYDRP